MPLLFSAFNASPRFSLSMLKVANAQSVPINSSYCASSSAGEIFLKRIEDKLSWGCSCHSELISHLQPTPAILTVCSFEKYSVDNTRIATQHCPVASKVWFRNVRPLFNLSRSLQSWSMKSFGAPVWFVSRPCVLISGIGSTLHLLKLEFRHKREQVSSSFQH